MTQKEQIINFLLDSEIVCGTVFQANFIPEYRTRINDLRKDGYLIGARPCTQHKHKSKILQEWYFIESPKTHYDHPEGIYVPQEVLEGLRTPPTGLKKASDELHEAPLQPTLL